jgi:EmrB/QacA subfamily drug resistance transporter
VFGHLRRIVFRLRWHGGRGFGHSRPDRCTQRREGEPLGPPATGKPSVVKRGDRKSAAGPPWDARPLALLVAGALFMELLDGTIVAPAAPAMARSFGVPASSIAEVITTYFLTVAIFIPVSGWVADRYGARTVFCSAVAIFSVSSALCGASTGLAMITMMRVVQGVGGAMMVPVGRLVVLRATDKKDIIRAIAYLTWPALVAPVVAPALGGALASYLSWRWIFFVNVPLGIVAFGWALRLVPQVRPGTVRSLDWTGFGLCAGCLGFLVEAASLVSASAVDLELLVVVVAAAVALGGLAVRHLCRSQGPLVDLSSFGTKTFRISHLGGSVFRLTVSSVPFLLPLMFQESFGWTAAKAGAIVTFLFIGNLGIKPLTTPLLRRWSFRGVLVLSCAAEAATFVVCGLLGSGTPIIFVGALLAVSGAFRSVGFTAYNTIAFADITPEHLRDANTLSMTLQQLAAGLGVAAGALALRAGVVFARLSAFNHLTKYQMAFFIMAVLILSPVVEATRVPANAGSAIRGKA